MGVGDTARRRLQERLCTRPLSRGSARVELEIVLSNLFHKTCQVGAVEVPLAPHPTGAYVPALGQRFLPVFPADAVAGKANASFCAFDFKPGGELQDLSAGALSLAGKFLEEHPRCPDVDGLAEHPLQGAVGKLFKFEDVAHAQGLIDHFADETPAVGGQPAPELRQAGLGLEVRVCLLPLLRPFPYRTVGAVVLRVVGSAGAVQPALEPAYFCFLLCKLLAKAIQARLFTVDTGDDRGPCVDADSPFCQGVFRFLVGCALADKLRVEPVATVYFSPHQADVLDPAGKSMTDYGIFLVNNGW